MTKTVGIGSLIGMFTMEIYKVLREGVKPEIINKPGKLLIIN